jgi:hypothetical protein
MDIDVVDVARFQSSIVQRGAYCDSRFDKRLPMPLSGVLLSVIRLLQSP